MLQLLPPCLYSSVNVNDPLFTNALDSCKKRTGQNQPPEYIFTQRAFIAAYWSHCGVVPVHQHSTRPPLPALLWPLLFTLGLSYSRCPARTLELPSVYHTNASMELTSDSAGSHGLSCRNGEGVKSRRLILVSFKSTNPFPLAVYWNNCDKSISFLTSQHICKKAWFSLGVPLLS